MVRREAHDHAGHPYYVETATGKSQWCALSRTVPTAGPSFHHCYALIKVTFNIPASSTDVFVVSSRDFPTKADDTWLPGTINSPARDVEDIKETQHIIYNPLPSLSPEHFEQEGSPRGADGSRNFEEEAYAYAEDGRMVGFFGGVSCLVLIVMAVCIWFVIDMTFERFVAHLPHTPFTNHHWCLPICTWGEGEFRSRLQGGGRSPSGRCNASSVHQLGCHSHMGGGRALYVILMGTDALCATARQG